MPKPIQFQLSGEVVSCELHSAIRREDLYGRTRRIVLGEDGESLQSGYLTQDGRLLSSEDYSTLFIDALGSFNGKMTYESGGEPVEQKFSSFKETRDLEKVDIEALKRFSVTAIYPIEGIEVEPGLYKTEFNYTASIETNPCLIMVRNDGPSFLLVGAKMEFTPLGKAVSYDLFDASSEEVEEDSGDFNFDMF